MLVKQCTGVKTVNALAAGQEGALPVLHLQVENTVPNDSMVPASLQWRNPDTLYQYRVRVERRGGYSIGFPKHSYELDLPKNEPLLGLPADDDWILNANYIDKTFLRHVYAYELFRAMHSENFAVESRYVELYLNDQYVGLYVLMQKLDKSALGIQRNDPEAVIFKEPPVFYPDITQFRPQRTNNYYQQTYPKKAKDDRSALADSLHHFLANSTDSLFAEKVAGWFDLRNVADWHLLLLLSNNADGLRKNFYLYRRAAGERLRVAPWDYDHAFGRDGDNEKNLIRPLDDRKCLLLERLLGVPTYQQLLLLRWQTLSQNGPLALGALQERVHTMASRFRSAIPANAQRWPVNAAHYYDDNDFEQELALFQTFLAMRWPQVDAYVKKVAQN